MDDRQFRNAMGKFATDVNVIATEVAGEVYGMTANAFMSIHGPEIGFHLRRK